MREDSSSGPIEHTLHGHSRAITDVNFSAHHPDMLATCSVDGYVHSWDLRRPRQPVTTFCDWFAGATQVKYNRQDAHIIASAHDRYLHIWDDRRPSEPLKSITAHTSKIYGIDWNRTRSTGIVTCSLDKSIKFWDYSTNVEEPEHVIRTPYPVWRARHTPFGWGLLAMPQNEPGNLYLYDRLWSDDSPTEATPDPVAVFTGHGDHQAKEFLWRSRGGISSEGMDERDFQLVSWGGDNELRLHCVDEKTFAGVGHYKGRPARKEIKITRKGAAYKTYRTVEESSSRERKSGTMSDHKAVVGILQKHQPSNGTRTPGTQQQRGAWRGPSMKARVTSAKTADKSQSQLGWMKGITMTKRKISTNRHASDDPSLLDHGFPSDDWGEPDTVQEELLRISTQLPKVNWENIDMDKLSLRASLNGPWGVDGESIFIKVEIDIPSNYPKEKAPKFSIEKTSFMPERTHRRIQREIHELASQFLRRKQNCLEVAFTYLLGEVDLESSTSFFKNVRDLDDDLDGLADDSSSEDEDTTNPGSTSMSQELGIAGEIDTTLAAPNRAMVPPPPRTCGARFSNTGKLICFFPSKEEKARALFSSAGDIFKDRMKGDGEPFFAGFGRMAQPAGLRQRLPGEETSVTEDQTDASDSDQSSFVSSGSDSESTSIHNMSIWYRSSRQLKKTWSEDRSVKSSGAGTGTGVGTGTGTGTSRRRIGRPRNVISVHDLSAMLPSKQDLAKEYAIFGDGAEVCEHNSKVAEKFGCLDLMHVWNYLALLLKKGIPLQHVRQQDSEDTILVIARQATMKSVSSRGTSKLVGRVKWGDHPLAKSIITELFHYFESIYDVQMLAMLSCIFSESSVDDSIAYVQRQLPQSATPLPLKAPSFSLDYFPPDATAWVQTPNSFSNSGVTTPATLHTPLHYGGSQISDEAWNGDTNPNSYSAGETPPSKAKEHLEQKSVLSKSPSSRTVQKTSAGLAMAFTANLTRQFTSTVSSSPPQPKKKPSPAEAILSSLAPRTGSSGVTHSTTAADSTGGRPSLSEDDYRGDMLSMVPINVAVILEDQSIFDDDGWLSKPLLESTASALHAGYRYAYAEMLQIWGQPLARLEVMKFNVIKEAVESKSGDDSYAPSEAPTILGPTKGPPSVVMGKKDRLQALAASGRGLDVRGMCRVHETQLDPVQFGPMGNRIGGAVGTCDRCHKTQSQLRCVYCLEPVDALFPPCLTCGCASHEECLAEWHAAGETLCPAGDECNCVEEASKGQVESWAALRSAMRSGQSHALSTMSDTLISPSAASMSPSSPNGLENEKGRLWRKAEASTVVGHVPRGTVGATMSPASLGFGAFKRAQGWGRMAGQRKTKRGG